MSEIYAMPGMLIRRLNQIAASLFQERMGRIGVDLTPVQFAALVAVRDHPEVDQATLAGLIAYDRATIGGVVDRLEAKGLIRRRVSETDRRARALALTAGGEGLLGRILPEVRAMQDEILAGLDATERAEFLRLAGKLAAAGNARSRAPLVARDGPGGS